MSYFTCDGVGFLVACSSLLWLLVSATTRSQSKEKQVTRNPTPSHVKYDMLPAYFKNNYRPKATLLGMNMLSDDGFIYKKPKHVAVLIS